MVISDELADIKLTRNGRMISAAFMMTHQLQAITQEKKFNKPLINRAKIKLSVIGVMVSKENITKM
jgi:hypothetical protein